MASSTLTAVARAARKAALAFQARDEAIRAAHAEGATLASIAKAAGMSKQRVHQIVHAYPTERRLVKTTQDASSATLTASSARTTHSPRPDEPWRERC